MTLNTEQPELTLPCPILFVLQLLWMHSRQTLSLGAA